ncbi:MAG: hypothetical protein L7U66_01895 [Acidimicrobiales bacterium]|nr:hypothetical protein [Acidimicrobiales bacterium]
MKARPWVWLLLVFALLATACGGEVDESADDGDETETVDDASAEENETEADEPEPDTEEDPGTAETDDGPNTYDDPRGGIFAEFQAGFDRGDHPFTQLDAFCVAHDAAADAQATDDGIEADSLTIVHLKSRLEDAINIGFGIPVGDMNDMFGVYIDYLNEQCGGIRGREIVLETIEVSLFGPTVETERNEACLKATEDLNAVMILNSSGFQGSATVCIVEAKETIFISTQGQPQDFMDRSEGRLVSLSNTNSESLEFAVARFLDSGVLTADSILGVASPDTPGQPETVEESLVAPLEAAGVEVVYDVIGCNGSTICTDGVVDSVTNMRNAGITHFFNVMGILTAPGYIDEMVNQGFEAGDVQFLASDFNSQSSELVSGQITNNPAAGALYNGAIINDFRTTGEYRNDGYEQSPWQSLCVDLYNENNTIGANHQWEDQGGDSAFGMAISICSMVRVMARAIYDAGDNPTRDDITAALNNLGPVDLSGMSPASITPGKGQMPDAIQTLDFSYPCDQRYPYVRNNGEAVCITGRQDWTFAPRN